MQGPLEETIAAIAMHFGMSKHLEAALKGAGRRDAFHNLYTLAISAAGILKDIGDHEPSWGDAADRTQQIEGYADGLLRLLAKQGGLLSTHDMQTLAKESIYRFMEPKMPGPLSKEEILLIRNALVSALEGGSNHWYQIKEKILPPHTKFADFKKGGRLQDPDDYFHWSELIPTYPGGALILVDREADEKGQEEWRLDLPALEKGFSILRHKYPKSYERFLSEDYDGDDGDLFLQLALFGEPVYG